FAGGPAHSVPLCACSLPACLPDETYKVKGSQGRQLWTAHKRLFLLEGFVGCVIALLLCKADGPSEAGSGKEQSVIAQQKGVLLQERKNHFLVMYASMA